MFDFLKTIGNSKETSKSEIKEIKNIKEDSNKKGNNRNEYDLNDELFEFNNKFERKKNFYEKQKKIPQVAQSNMNFRDKQKTREKTPNRFENTKNLQIFNSSEKKKEKNIVSQTFADFLNISEFVKDVKTNPVNREKELFQDTHERNKIFSKKSEISNINNSNHRKIFESPTRNIQIFKPDISKKKNFLY